MLIVGSAQIYSGHWAVGSEEVSSNSEQCSYVVGSVEVSGDTIW